MNIKDRISKICPGSAVFWDGSLMRITVIYDKNPDISADIIKSKICAELSQAGLLRAVSEIHVMY